MRTVLAGLVLLCLLIHLFPATARGKSDWSKVGAVPPGTRTTVELYKDRAPSGKRKIEGHFRSATAKNITLLLPDGKRRTLQKPAVRKVLVYRPLMGQAADKALHERMTAGQVAVARKLAAGLSERIESSKSQ